MPGHGGQPETVVPPDQSARYTAPDVLPGGKGLLVTVTNRQTGVESEVGVVSLEGGPVRTLFPGNMARYVNPGYVVFSNQTGQLKAVAFDP